ncbi:peptidoglycan-binding domain-containing protein [Acidimangrovimonas sediminis]|uniref:peptidoglycan-binding domain-containing protein n=1 Tax=Acidimangrovimonas sediminis TaxID=2056283 RepID=UPI000C805247|nr:peptidoglycan-binding domain-containing protein [Acidimangrovimonas sediminis]
MIRPFLIGLMALGLAACTGAPGERDVERGPGDIDGYSLASEIVTRTEPGPPSTVPGECWTHTTLPAVIQTTTEHVETAPGVFSTVSHQQIVRQRRKVWFRSPCPAQMTPEFIASLQRALKARGLYTLPLTGRMDAPTRKAVGRYQSSLGLDSDILSTGAARQLGLEAYSLWDLKQNLD